MACHILAGQLDNTFSATSVQPITDLLASFLWLTLSVCEPECNYKTYDIESAQGEEGGHDIPSKIYVLSYHVAQMGNGNTLQLLEPGRACKQARMGWGNAYFCSGYHVVLRDFTLAFI